MSIQTHLAELERKHALLERQLSDAMNHPSAADAEIASLKRKKLALKDEIKRLKPGSAVH